MGYYPLGVARFTSGGDVLPAKSPDNNANVFAIKSCSVAYSSTFEVLIINAAAYVGYTMMHQVAIPYPPEQSRVVNCPMEPLSTWH